METTAAASKKNEKKKSQKSMFDIDIRDITTNNNPRNPLSLELQQMGYDVFIGDKPLWPLATSDDPEQRAEFVRLIMEHDPELVAMATTFITLGQLQPIEVREGGSGKFALIFGARRCLAKLLNWCTFGKPAKPEIQAVMFKGNDGTAFHRSTTENYMRKPPSPVEEARAFERMVNNGETKDAIAEQQGVSIATINNRLRLLKLPEKDIQAVHVGEKSVSDVLKNGDKKKPEGSAPAVDTPKMRKRKEIEEIRKEYADSTTEAKLLDWILGLRETIKDS